MYLNHKHFHTLKMYLLLDRFFDIFAWKLLNSYSESQGTYLD